MEERVPRSRESSSGSRAEVASLTRVLGARIRAERVRTGLTIRGLASRTGVSYSLISHIERGKARPSVGSLWAIASELGVSVADLFSDRAPSENGRRSPIASPVQPHETRKAITLAGDVRWERLTSSPDDEVDFVHAVYPVGAASCDEDALMRHVGREFGYVLSGTLGVRVGFDEYVIRPNDSISFDSSLPHRMWAIGDEPVAAIWIVINAPAISAEAERKKRYGLAARV